MSTTVIRFWVEHYNKQFIITITSQHNFPVLNNKYQYSAHNKVWAFNFDFRRILRIAQNTIITVLQAVAALVAKTRKSNGKPGCFKGCQFGECSSVQIVQWQNRVF